MNKQSHKPRGAVDWSWYSPFNPSLHDRESDGTHANDVFWCPCWPSLPIFSSCTGWDWMEEFCWGKNFTKLGHLQLQYYQELHSRCSVDQWTSGLVSHLLELTHGMWIHWNGIDHAVDKQGLLVCLAADIQAAIHEEFQKGTNSLDRCDFCFIWWGCDNVMSLLAVDKWVGCKGFNWLEILALLLCLLIDNNNNWWKTSFILQMIDSTILPSPELYTQSLNWPLDTVLHPTLMVTPSHGQLLFDQVGGSTMGCSFFIFGGIIGELYWLWISGAEQLKIHYQEIVV